MTDNFAVAATAQAHAADIEFLIRRGMRKGYQWVSILTPPARLCAVGGGAFEYVRSAYSNQENVRGRRIRAAYDTASIRADDHSTIGGILFAVLTPAILWKRAHPVNLVLGGAGVGSAVGSLAHHVRTFSGDPPPHVVTPSVPEAAIPPTPPA